MSASTKSVSSGGVSSGAEQVVRALLPFTVSPSNDITSVPAGWRQYSEWRYSRFGFLRCYRTNPFAGKVPAFNKQGVYDPCAYASYLYKAGDWGTEVRFEEGDGPDEGFEISQSMGFRRCDTTPGDIRLVLSEEADPTFFALSEGLPAGLSEVRFQPPKAPYPKKKKEQLPAWEWEDNREPTIWSDAMAWLLFDKGVTFKDSAALTYHWPKVRGNPAKIVHWSQESQAACADGSVAPIIEIVRA